MCALHARLDRAAVGGRVATRVGAGVVLLHLPVIRTGGWLGIAREAHARHGTDDLAQFALDPSFHRLGALTCADHRLGAGVEDALVDDDLSDPNTLLVVDDVHARVWVADALDGVDDGPLDVAVGVVVCARTGVDPDLDDETAWLQGRPLQLGGLRARGMRKRWEIITQKNNFCQAKTPQMRGFGL